MLVLRRVLAWSIERLDWNCNMVRWTSRGRKQRCAILPHRTIHLTEVRRLQHGALVFRQVAFMKLSRFRTADPKPDEQLAAPDCEYDPDAILDGQGITDPTTVQQHLGGAVGQREVEQSDHRQADADAQQSYQWPPLFEVGRRSPGSISLGSEHEFRFASGEFRYPCWSRIMISPVSGSRSMIVRVGRGLAGGSAAIG
jgi:hypothetical protein